MNPVLIDTQAMIWFVDDNPKLSKTGLALVETQELIK